MPQTYTIRFIREDKQVALQVDSILLEEILEYIGEKYGYNSITSVIKS